ncbi:MULTISPECIES: glycoside-pentoside-hexuronide (GPH):cation symporter [Heyndrickxia]|uniref:glycoside-pentoside-hexuronide (GPH):cation symporter n=1 Tax=Heyndrickxia TaxID=2837504 RepID=UPI001459698E|nr:MULTISPECIES: glycoside-pentoside-hexuronide (GPH):cation symporter [Heyndrickxia]NWN93754.1 MFS transporter [Bacillus sp. (in: firmicutes)]MED4838812.1 glycoside-pentoside-hexuronide (GPH):cation symporter [Weizmannia sp. CD-2023]MED4892563.1 glycoside-pentoside-hexuronide (GPH):cation symporter [Weizmannia sp. CD-2023]MED4900527.1 glycoside-pentoside-hexuronide (GPH):cation symporter [Weizmannia sp. CD-2023]MED4975103.1 glycoside-pentoside-hexuronide (GPH):cation symporter [Weizmannia sp.
MAESVVKTTAEKIIDPQHASKRISLKEKVSYGFGDFGNGFMFDLGQSYLTNFYTDVAGISAAAAAGVFSITKIFDAFMDPLAGSIIDSRTPGKRGKFRPVMMVSSVLLAIMTVIIFIMPSGLSPTMKIVYAYATYMAWGILYSFTNVPYGSLASVMTRNVDDRSFMASTRQAGSIGAQLVTGVAFVPIMLLFSNTKVGYAVTAAIMAFIGICGFFICYINTKEHIHAENSRSKERETMKDYLRVVFTNRPLWSLILMTLFTISAMNTNNQMMIYFCKYNLNNIGLQPIINFIMMGCSVAGITLIPFLVKKFGKKKTAIGGLIIGVVADALNFVIPTNIVTFIILVTIGYVALAIPNGVTWAFVSDTIDYGHWHTGVRKEGITYAAFNFSRKIAQSIAALVSAGILAATGYIANAHQSSTTLLGIKGAMTIYPAVALLLAAIIITLLYNLPDDKFKQIANDLENGRWEKGTFIQG